MISKQDIKQMNEIYRLHFINSVTGFKSASLIGTKSRNGITNVAVFSSVTHLGSNPPLAGFFVKPGDDPPDTFNNILQTKSYTINHISSLQAKGAHQTSARYPSNRSEFSEVGFKEEYSGTVYAPYVSESSVKIGLEYQDHYKILINDTVLIVGEIVEIGVPDQFVEPDGHIDLNKAKTMTISGLDAYHKPEKPQRFGYAKLSGEE
ncbi:MAG: flavin reductase [Balneolaceae bacterium]|nr:flavin reductase [Balneolaceae bacterium]